MKRIGLFGGSFDPIHIGHVEVALEALKELELDEVQFVPTKNNPWKDSSLASTQERIDMIKLAIEDKPGLSINLIEANLDSNEKNYTIDTLNTLIQNHPDTKYYYIMGMDQVEKFNEWKEATRISEIVQLVAFQRGGYTSIHPHIDQYHFIQLNNEPITASSSDAREGKISILDKKVLYYITHQGIYLEGIIKPHMKEKRWLHSISVAKLAKEIAEANNLNGQEAYIAGMFHDIAKEMDEEQSIYLMKTHFNQYIDKPKAIWHQWLSAYVSENTYLIDNPTILKAIEDHTTGSTSMSLLGKCVYCADKLDPLRGYDSSSQIEVCKKDINQGFRDSLIDFYQFSKSKNRNIDECFYEIYNKYVEKGEI